MTKESMYVALKRRWWVVVLLTLLGVALGATPRPERAADASTTWSATHTLTVGTTDPTQNGFIDQVTFNQLQLFATTGDVPAAVAKTIGFDGSGQALASQIVVTADNAKASLTITTTQEDPATAVSVVDAFGEELQTFIAARQDGLREQRLTASLTRLTSLEERLRELSDEAARDPDDAVARAKVDALSRQYSVTFEQYDTLRSEDNQLVLTTLGRGEAVARTEDGLSAPRSRTTRGAFGGLVGLAAGVGAALLLARLDRRIRTVEQAEQIFGVRAQLAIPYATGSDLMGIAIQHDRHDGLSDAYRRLRSIVSFVEGGLEKPDGIAALTLVVSAGPSEGKTSVTSNLAAAIVESGSTAIAVNTDFRRPSLTQRLLGRRHVHANLALRDVRNTPLGDLVLRGDPPDLGIFDLAGIEASPGDLARATRRALPDMQRVADSVIVDTSPIGATAEVLEMIPVADVIIVVVRLGQTSLAAATRAGDTLRALSHAETLLVIVGSSSERAGSYYYEYSAPVPRQRRGRRRT